MRERRNISTRTRFEVLKRDKFTCQYCGAKAPHVVLHVDHVEAVARGGGDATDNLATACASCNLGKGAIDLAQKLPNPSDVGVGDYILRASEHVYEGWLSCCDLALTLTGWPALSTEHINCLSVAVRALSSEYVSQALREHLTHDLGVAEMVSVLDRIVVLTDRTIGRIVMADMEAERGAAI